MTRRILLVDDDATVLESLGDALADEGMAVRTAAGAAEALHLVGEAPPDVILTDVRMPAMDGLELLGILRDRVPETDVVLMTAYDDMPTVVEAMREGAVEFLVKPLDLHALRKVLDRIFEDRLLRERVERQTEEQSSRYRLDELVGRTPAMIEIYKTVGQLAGSRANVLIRGETGTGKELIARAIHYNSADASEPFIPVNCTALASGVLESELFGHVKGAFTGAHTSRKGRFELAGRGTVFLDEIGDTTPEFQAKLLRVLQEGEFFPVGAETPVATDARIIAATHRDLERMIGDDAFRSDLYYRLRVVEVTVPPLRDRPADVPLLAEHLLEKVSREMHEEPPVLSDEALEVLESHAWPGNVRELENCLTRAAVLSAGDVLRPEHVLLGPRPPGSPDGLPTLDEVEAKHVARVLEATGFHKTRSAEILGISRPRLNRIIEKHELE